MYVNDENIIRGLHIYLFHHFQTQPLSSSEGAFQLLFHCTPVDRKGQRGHMTGGEKEDFKSVVGGQMM